MNNFDFLDYREELKKKLSSPIPEGKDCISQCWRNVDLPPADIPAGSTWSGNHDISIVYASFIDLVLFLVCETK